MLFIALAIAAPVHGHATVEPRTDEERGSLQAYSACLYGYAREIDDDAIDPLILSRRVAPKCRFQLGIAASILSRDKPRAERDALYRQWLAIEDQQAIRVILTMRLDRRATRLDPADPRQGKPVAPKPAPAKRLTMTFADPKPGIRPIPTIGPDGKPMSEWRRAYIARHGHEPPVPPR